MDEVNEQTSPTIFSLTFKIRFVHFANTLAPIHTTVIWAYFGAKEINSSFDLLLTASSCVPPGAVDEVVHLEWSTFSTL
jgi:hypothetical protein